ncbi:MAG: flagellar hook-length control protein FliK [Candidatus Sericytochromatia bacterium]
MTQTASIDLGALAAPPRRDYAPGPKNQSDFVEAYRQAETSAPEPKKNDRPERPDTDRKDPLDKAVADAPAKDAPAEAPKADKPKVEEPKAEQAEAPKTEKNEKSEAEQGEVKAEAPAQTPEEAQAALALALATGGQLAAPTQQTQATETEGEAVKADQATQVKAEVTTATAATPETAEEEVIVSELTSRKIAAEAARTQGQQQAAAKAQAPQVAEAVEHADENAKLPAFLQQAAQGLGKISVTAKTEQVPGQPTGSQETVLSAESSNLSIAMRDAAQTVTTGSNTQAVLLDEAMNLETNIQTVTLTEGEEGAEEVVVAEDGPDGLTALQGDRAQVHGGKAAEVKAPQQPAKPEEVMPQILKHAEQLKANQQSSIKLHLYPEHLGRLEIKVTTHQGMIQAQLTADSQAVKGMLEGQMAQLQRSFAEMGLKVDRVEVTLASADMQFDASGQMTQGQADQGFSQQQRTSQQTHAFNGSGYEQWLPEELSEEGYADMASLTAINFVA